VATPAGVRVSGAHVTRQGDLTLISPKPSQAVAATIRSGDKTIRLLVVSQAEAKTLWVGQVAGAQRLVETGDEVSFDDDSLELRSMGDPNFRLGVYPALSAAPKADLALTPSERDGVFQVFAAKAPEKVITASLTEVRPAGVAPPISIGGLAARALQPYPEAFGRSAAWSIILPKDAIEGVADAFLNIDYQGDVARLFSGVEMLDDDYYYGGVWSIGLKRYRAQIQAPLTLTVLPLRKDAPIYIDDAVRAQLPPADQVAVVRSIKVVPQYALKIQY
jgi:hypothetical protein